MNWFISKAVSRIQLQCEKQVKTSDQVTRFGDLLDFGQLFKAFGDFFLVTLPVTKNGSLTLANQLWQGIEWAIFTYT